MFNHWPTSLRTFQRTVAFLSRSIRLLYCISTAPLGRSDEARGQVRMMVGAKAAASIIVIAALWVVLAAALAILAARPLRRAQRGRGPGRPMRALPVAR